MNEASGALVGVHPIADLHDGELEDAPVHDVTGVLTDLDPVTQIEGSAPQDEEPTGQVGDQVLQGDRQARRQEAQEGPQRLYRGEPDLDEDQHPDDEGGVSGRLRPAIAEGGRLGTGGNEGHDRSTRE